MRFRDAIKLYLLDPDTWLWIIYAMVTGVFIYVIIFTLLHCTGGIPIEW